MPRLLAIAGAAVILVAMTGCIHPKPPATPTPTASAAPVFASEEEALAAAEESYARYLAVSDQILQEGGSGGERIAPLVTAGELADTVQGFEDFAAKNLRAGGTTTFDRMTLVQYDRTAVEVYVCLDVSQVRIFDANGTDVTVPDRDNRLPLNVSFEVSNDSLVLSRSETWTGDDFC